MEMCSLSYLSERKNDGRFTENHNPEYIDICKKRTNNVQSQLF